MKGIDYCTNCGEPMPKPKIEEPKEEAAPQKVVLTEKEFRAHYLPYSARLALMAGAVISYFYAALYLLPALLYIALGKAIAADFILGGGAVILALLTFGFHKKKSTFCAVLTTIVSVIFSIYCLIAFHQITFIWIFAGIMACYGTMKYNALWNNYKKKGIIPKRVGQ